MRRTVSCSMEATVADARDDAELVLAVAVASGTTLESESLVVAIDGRPLELTEIADEHGGRLHRATGFGNGQLHVEYQADAAGQAPPPPVVDLDLVRYARPSRYCESDQLAAFAQAEFHGLDGRALLDAVSSWVGMRVAYVAGSSRSTDGAVATLLARQGVCRDFAHLVTAMMRSCDVPARVVAVYAPGLQPMDFHAVAEAYVDGHWVVADATCLAPRTAMLRIATGRDAADTAFLSSARCSLELTALDVMATIDGDLPADDVTEPVQLA